MSRFVSQVLLANFVRDLFTLVAAPEGALCRRDRQRSRALRRAVTAQAYLPLLRLVLRQPAVWRGRQSPLWRLLRRFRDGLELEADRNHVLPENAATLVFGPLDVAVALAAARPTRPVPPLPSVAA